MVKLNAKGLREDHFIPSEVEEGEVFRGGRNPKYTSGDPSKFTPDEPDPIVFNWRKRHEWGSPPPFEEDEGILVKHPLEHVIFSFTECEDIYWEVDCKYWLLNKRDELKKQGMYELPWNFIVGGDGTVYEARGWDRLPEPFPDAPLIAGKAFEIAHFGTRGVIPPNEKQIASSWEVVAEGIKKKYLTALPQRWSFFYKEQRKDDKK